MPVVGDVLHLLFLSHPAAVAWFIVSVAVDAVDGKAIGIAVGKRPRLESLEFMPCITDADASPPIVYKIVTLWVAASIQHVPPDDKQATPAFSVPAITPAPAADLAAISQFCGHGCSRVPTVTLADPNGLLVLVILIGAAYNN